MIAGAYDYPLEIRSASPYGAPGATSRPDPDLPGVTWTNTLVVSSTVRESAARERRSSASRVDPATVLQSE